MPRFSKKAISSRRNGAKSKAVLALTEEQHTFFESAPALTLSAPERFWVERGSSARKMHLLAPSPATVINGVSLRNCLRVRRSREEHVAAAIRSYGGFQAIQAPSSLGERICAMYLI